MFVKKNGFSNDNFSLKTKLQCKVKLILNDN